ncbi:hypothetical protein TIFTF001_023390 [Ficus carica]|uniref:Uncharacterized protein n=1 Tax=Ficus carica TaxID=3494 RepID=A0AA88AJH0_FICCA|nr:hypothetical protein TIFTF001_023390 [Ficus carica]
MNEISLAMFSLWGLVLQHESHFNPIFAKDPNLTACSDRPCASPEYRSAVPDALEYYLSCPVTAKIKPFVHTFNPETAYECKYYTGGRRCNCPPIKRTILRKVDVERRAPLLDFESHGGTTYFLHRPVGFGRDLLPSRDQEPCPPSAWGSWGCKGAQTIYNPFGCRSEIASWRAEWARTVW